MKTKHFIGLYALSISLLFLACQKDELAEPLTNHDSVIKTRAASFTYAPSNPCPGDEVTVTFANESANCGNVQIQQWIDGEYAQVIQTDGNTASYTFIAEEGNNDFRAQWFRTGNPATCPGNNTGWIESSLSVAPCCVNTFDADLTCSTSTCGNTLIVTFVTEDYSGPIVIQGGLTAGAEICTRSATGGLLENTDHPSGGGPSSVTRWEGDVVACETYTVSITFTGGNGVGDWSAKAPGDVVLGSSLDQVCN